MSKIIFFSWKHLIPFYLLVSLMSSGCVSYSSLLSYNESPGIPFTPQAILNYTPITIQQNDILVVQISGVDPQALAPFLTGSTTSSNSGSPAGEFIVNNKGKIILPTLGAIDVVGLTTEVARNKIIQKLQPYFELSPIVNLRLRNFKVNINGEIKRPGPVSVNSERLTIIEAITSAGDFTDYAKRDSVLIIREAEGMRTFGYVNFNSTEVFDSPFFYLQQNDVVYVQPNKTKVNAIRDPASRFLPWITAAISVAALLISIAR